MALAPINPTQLTPPRVEFIDPRTGAISREWYRFFLSLLTATQTNQEEVTLSPDTTSLLATYDAMLASATQATETQPEGASVSALAIVQSDIQALSLAPSSPSGTVTSVAASGGTTGLTFTGSPITTSGTLTLGGTLAVANGGTGQTSYTDGQLLIGNTTGNTLTKATLIAGSGVSIANGAGSITISATGSGGTVTSVSVVSANGFAGTVATATTTPAITLSTSVTGLVKGNGTALSAAVAATDYVAPSAYASANGLTMATSRLLGRTTASTGAAEEISVAGGLTLSGGVLTGASGTVTSVTGTAPVVSSGGSTPAISMAAATTSVNGYLTSTDWNTFNNKGSGTVTSVAALTLGTTGTDLSSTVANGTTTPVITLQVPTASATNRGALSAADWTTFNSKGSGSVTSVGQTFTGGLISVAGSPITTSGTLALTVAGTSGGIPYFSSGTTWATSAALAANAIVVGGGAGLAPATVTTGTGVVTALGVNVGTAGSFIVNGGALGTPSSGTVTNLTGTASININGTVGATTPTTGAFTSVSLTAGSALAWNADVGLSRSAAATLNLGNGTAGSSSGTLVLTKTNFAGNANLTSPSSGNLQLGTGATTGAGGSLSLTGLTASGTVSANSLTLTTALSVGNGGTGATTITSGRLVKANGSSAFSASLVYDDGTNSGIVSGNFIIDAGSLQTKSNGSTAIANALNDNLVITVGTGFTTFTGGGALAQLGGMVAGANGQRVAILNTTGSGITVIGESATSTAANRIWTQGLNPATWNNLGTREFIYSTVQSRWLMIGSNAA